MYKVSCSALGIRSETGSEDMTLYIHSTLYTLLPLIFYRFFLDFSKPDLDDLCRKIVHQIHRSTLYRTIFCLISNLQRYWFSAVFQTIVLQLASSNLALCFQLNWMTYSPCGILNEFELTLSRQWVWNEASGIRRLQISRTKTMCYYILEQTPCKFFCE